MGMEGAEMGMSCQHFFFGGHPVTADHPHPCHLCAGTNGHQPGPHSNRHTQGVARGSFHQPEWVPGPVSTVSMIVQSSYSTGYYRT